MGYDQVKCPICGEHVSARRLTQHQKTQACRRAAAMKRVHKAGFVSASSWQVVPRLHQLGLPVMQVPAERRGRGPSYYGPRWAVLLLSMHLPTYMKWARKPYIEWVMADKERQAAHQAAQRVGGESTLREMLMTRMHQRVVTKPRPPYCRGGGTATIGHRGEDMPSGWSND